jgi:aspartate racemase
MKTLGMIGGIGPESTIEYYRLILARYRELRPDGTSPSIVINSIDLKKLLNLTAAPQRDHLIAYLRAEFERLKAAGATIALMAANIPHLVFEDLRRQVAIPLISIVEVTCRAAGTAGLSRVGLLGTTFTMRGGFYQEVFGRAGPTVVTPEVDDQAFVHQIYMQELVLGVLRSETRDRLWEIIHAMKRREGIEGVVLGGTELSLILKEEDGHGIPVLDTTRLHAEAAAAELVEGS